MKTVQILPLSIIGYRNGNESMLDKTRLRNRKLFDLIMSADEAATMITNGMTVACGGFTSTGCPKAVPLALARAAENGSNHKITLLSGGSVGPEVE